MTDVDLPGVRVWRVLAPNPGPLTLEGTNTWLLAAPGAARAVVVDPGPDDPAHLDAIAAAATAGGVAVAEVLLTHRHADHAAGARAFADRAGAPVRASGAGLADGQAVAVDGLELRVLATPGHSADHVCFVLDAARAVLTGDHVLGRGTTLVAHPDGRMGDYLASLRRLAGVGATTLLPGHGPVVPDAAEVVARYLAHRAERERQILDAVARGAATPAAVVAAVYADVDPRLHPAAELSVRAHLALLAETGRVGVDPAGSLHVVPQ